MEANGHRRSDPALKSRRNLIMQLAIDLGCNFFDTAWAHGDGKSDGPLGEIMARNHGKRIYAASKIPPRI